jgi:hypothetical protein
MIYILRVDGTSFPCWYFTMMRTCLIIWNVINSGACYAGQNTCRIWVEKPEGMRQLATSRCRWENDIKVDFQEQYGLDSCT